MDLSSNLQPAGDDALSLGSEISSGNWYHGSPHAGLSPEVLSVHKSNYGSLFGPGVYLTDNPEIADTYASRLGRANGPRSSATNTIYRASTKIGAAIDAEKPISPDILKSMMGSLGDGDPEGAIRQALQKDNSFASAYRASINNLRNLYDNMHQADFPDRIQEFFGNLKDAGYDAIRYDGGKRVGQLSKTTGQNILHNAVNIIDPNGELATTSSIMKPQPSILRFDPVGTLEDIMHSLAQPMAGAFVPPFMNDAMQDYQKNQQIEDYRAHGS